MPRRIKRKNVNGENRRGEHRAAVNPNRGPSVTSDREWADHKYIDKVKTKTGKIRYIYDDAYGSGRNYKNKNFNNSQELDEYVHNTLDLVPGPLGDILPITYESGKRVLPKLKKMIEDGQKWVRENIKLPNKPNLFSDLANAAGHLISDGASWVSNNIGAGIYSALYVSTDTINTHAIIEDYNNHHSGKNSKRSH